MKVLVCIPCLLTGGTEIQTLSLVKALVDAGHQVTTVCYFEHSDEMVARFGEAGCNVELLSPQGSRQAGLIKQIVFLYKGLRRIVTQEQPDAAHIQYMAPGAIPIVLLRWLGVRKIIATAHTAADIYHSLRLLHFITRHLLTAFTCITLRAEKSFFGTAQLFTANMPLKTKGNHFTIYNCLPHYITVRDKPRHLSTDSPVTIGVVSRLENIKGMDLVIPAFAKVHKMHTNTQLLVVGEGSLRRTMQCQAKELGLLNEVKFVGRQAQEALQGFYDTIDILPMPSRSEGFGLTAIEAMARGCVVVAAETGGLPEIVTSDVGLLHQPESVDDLSKKIEMLLSNRHLLSALSTASLEHAKRFSYPIYHLAITHLYKKLQ